MMCHIGMDVPSWVVPTHKTRESLLFIPGTKIREATVKVKVDLWLSVPIQCTEIAEIAKAQSSPTAIHNFN